MNVFICIDDTDTIDSKGIMGTGTIAEMIKSMLELKFGPCAYITRHQLLIHEDVPYTSHNSCMCLEAEINENDYEDAKKACIALLEKEHLLGSDPGFCMVKREEIIDKEALIKYGNDTKKLLMTKEIAYDLASHCHIHLSEHGGTGQGVIGALAGVGLRLGGEDGEIKGTLKQQMGKQFAYQTLMSLPIIDKIVDINMKKISEKALINIGERSKTILKGGKQVLVVQKVADKEGELYETCNKKWLRKLDEQMLEGKNCAHFIPDVEEERLTDASFVCLNCTFRRWTTGGFDCLYEEV